MSENQHTSRLEVNYWGGNTQLQSTQGTHHLIFTSNVFKTVLMAMQNFSWQPWGLYSLHVCSHVVLYICVKVISFSRMATGLRTVNRVLFTGACKDTTSCTVLQVCLQSHNTKIHRCYIHKHESHSTDTVMFTENACHTKLCIGARA